MSNSCLNLQALLHAVFTQEPRALEDLFQEYQPFINCWGLQRLYDPVLAIATLCMARYGLEYDLTHWKECRRIIKFMLESLQPGQDALLEWGRSRTGAEWQAAYYLCKNHETDPLSIEKHPFPLEHANGQPPFTGVAHPPLAALTQRGGLNPGIQDHSGRDACPGPPLRQVDAMGRKTKYYHLLKHLDPNLCYPVFRIVNEAADLGLLDPFLVEGQTLRTEKLRYRLSLNRLASVAKFPQVPDETVTLHDIPHPAYLGSRWCEAAKPYLESG